MTQAHLDLQSQLDSQNISNISVPTTTPLCNTSPIFFLSPIEPTNNQIEQMDTNISKSSDTDNNDMSSQNYKPSEQSAATPPPSEKKYDILKNPIFLTSPVYPPLISPKDSISTQLDEYLIQFYQTKISHSNLNSYLYICTQHTTLLHYMTKTKTSSLLLPQK